MRVRRRIGNVPRPKITPAVFLVLSLAVSFGCAPPGGGQANETVSSATNGLPEITEEMIHDRINGSRVRKVPEENAAAEPISWGFDENEPKEIRVVEQQVEGTRATIVLDIKTSSAPKSREPRSLAGQIRTDWELQTGWALRKWEIINVENISMKYKNLSAPPAQNANR